MLELPQKIESVLFFKSEGASIDELSKTVGSDKSEVENALNKLEEELSSRGIRLMRKDKKVRLVTAPEAGELIESLLKEELDRDLGKAGLETLSIVLYYGPVSRGEIDYIRGVNSSFILRNLMVRGLVERVTKKSDSRIYIYKPTFELLSHLGVTKIEELPNYTEMREKIEAFKEAQEVVNKEKKDA